MHGFCKAQVNSSLGDPDWQVPVLNDFKRVVGNHRAPAPGFFSCSPDPIASPGDSFILFFEVLCSKPVAAGQPGPSWGWGTRRDSGVHPPTRAFFCLFHRSVTAVPPFSSRSGGAPLPEALPGALSSRAERAAHAVVQPRPRPGTLRTWSRLNRTLCVFSGYFSDCREIVLNSVLARRILAIPSRHQYVYCLFGGCEAWPTLSFIPCVRTRWGRASVFSFLTHPNKLVNTNHGHHSDGRKVLYPGIASFLCCTIVTVPSQAFEIWRCAALCTRVWLKGCEFCV